jgi:hypothetical protein
MRLFSRAGEVVPSGMDDHVSVPTSRLVDDEPGLPEDPQLERTELRHAFLRAMARRTDGGGLSLAMDIFVNENDFTAAVTEPFGHELNVFGVVLLGLWDREFGSPAI